MTRPSLSPPSSSSPGQELHLSAPGAGRSCRAPLASPLQWSEYQEGKKPTEDLMSCREPQSHQIEGWGSGTDPGAHLPAASTALKDRHEAAPLIPCLQHGVGLQAQAPALGGADCRSREVSRGLPGCWQAWMITCGTCTCLTVCNLCPGSTGPRGPGTPFWHLRDLVTDLMALGDSASSRNRPRLQLIRDSKKFLEGPPELGTAQAPQALHTNRLPP